MSKYITTDGNNWDYLLSDESNIINEMKEHDFFYIICLMGTKCIYDSIKDNQELPYVDNIFDYFYENINDTEINEETIRAYHSFVHYTIMYILSHSQDENLKIAVQANNKINDDDLYNRISKNIIVSVDINTVNYEYDGEKEKYAQQYIIKYNDGTVLNIITTENRFVINTLLKIN